MTPSSTRHLQSFTVLLTVATFTYGICFGFYKLAAVNLLVFAIWEQVYRMGQNERLTGPKSYRNQRPGQPD
jgi:hypothetical protein